MFTQSTTTNRKKRRRRIFFFWITTKPNFTIMGTLRLASQSNIAAATGPNGSHYALFNSTSVIPRVTSWKPTSPTSLVLRFDAKGVITQALKASQVKSVRAMSHVSGVGLIIVSGSGIYKG